MSDSLEPASATRFLALVGALLSSSSCSQTECADADYTRAECRVVAETEFARLRGANDIEVSFQPADAGAPLDNRWVAEGLLSFDANTDVITARVAHMGKFALSVRNHGSDSQTVKLRLDNVHPLATLNLPAATPQPLVRELEVSVAPGETEWIRGGLDLDGRCDSLDTLYFAAFADVQGRLSVFRSIIADINEVAETFTHDDALFAGVIMPGDLIESNEERFEGFRGELAAAAVPFALTPGNHDIHDAISPEFNLNFGPGNYGFDVCGVRVAMLDTGSGSIANSIYSRLPGLFGYGDSEFLIAAMHHPPYPGDTAAGWSREDVATMMLADFALAGGDLLLTGHAHLLRDFPMVPLPATDGGSSHAQQIIAGTGGASQGAGQPIHGYVLIELGKQEGKWALTDLCFVEVPREPGNESLGCTLVPTG